MIQESSGDAANGCSCCKWRAGGIDVHAHYYPEAYLNLIEAAGGPFGAKIERTANGMKVQVGPLFAGPVHSKFICIEERLEAMDKQGVTVQALSLTQPMVYWAPPPLSRQLSATFNDAVAQAHEDHSARLVGLAIIPMQHTETALLELERVAALPGIRGVYMATCVAGKDLSDPSFWPIYERIEDLGLPIFLHPVEVIGMTDRLAKYFLSNLLGNPFDTAVAASHLIFGGVLDRFPKLDFVLPHGGGALPYLLGRLEHGWTVRHECMHLPRSPREYLPRFYYDTITHSQEALRYLIDLVGSERVLLGSDYCFDMGYEHPISALDGHAGLTEAQRTAILSGNAAELLRIQAPLAAKGAEGSENQRSTVHVAG
jgi:aminocarboxymuconate-semialdehyde decarboxylase